jgi:AI-2 transport system permease protein
MPFLSRLLKERELSLILLMVLFFIIVGSVNNDFISGDTISLMVKASVILLVMAVGQSFVLFTSNIDVSVGSVMGLSAAICGVLLTGGYNIWLVILLVILIGIIIGIINGLGVAYFKVPSIIMTLGMLGIVRGVMLLYTEGMWIEDIPNFYKELSGIKLLGLTLPVWVTICILLIAHIFLTRSTYGRYFFAVGDNEDGAKLVGLPVNKVKLIAFIFSGMSASIAGLIFVMNIGFVPNQTGSGIELQVIVAAVLGGVSLTGGQGSIIGAGIGAIFFTVINNSLVFLKIPAYWNDAISGFLLLVIVVGDSRFQTYLVNHHLKNTNEKTNDLHLSMKGDVNNDKQNKAAT